MANPDRRRKATTAALIATALAVPAEGLRQYAYYDPPGILTVCYGSTSGVEKGKKYSLEECRARLNTDMAEAIAHVERCAPGLPVNVLAAFGDAVYNMGPTIACNTTRSTAARMLTAGDLTGACKQLPRWDKANFAGVMLPLPGLTKRRAAEQALCLTPDDRAA
jgi:lysozyme